MKYLAAAVAALALPLSTAHAAGMAPCLPGHPQACHVWNAKVTFVADGDTVYARVNGRRKRKRIRLTGVNAQEMTRYSPIRRQRRGLCHAVEANNYLERLVRASHWRVRLLAQDPASHSGPRPRRAMQVRLRGRWQDVGLKLLAHGDALWLPNGQEWAWNGAYSRLAQATARRHLRLWDPNGCGRGPRASLRLWVNWHAAGDDVDNEWARITNTDQSDALRLGGWRLRTSDLRYYRFPRGTSVPAGEGLTLHVGSGRGTRLNRFWGLGAPVFDNPTDDQRQRGDGAYLFDSRGNMRAWVMWPCRAGCTGAASVGR